MNLAVQLDSLGEFRQIHGSNHLGTVLLFMLLAGRTTHSVPTTLHWKSTVWYAQDQRISGRLGKSLQGSELEQVGIVVDCPCGIREIAKCGGFPASSFKSGLTFFLGLNNLRKGFLHFARKHDVLYVC